MYKATTMLLSNLTIAKSKGKREKGPFGTQHAGCYVTQSQSAQLQLRTVSRPYNSVQVRASPYN